MIKAQHICLAKIQKNFYISTIKAQGFTQAHKARERIELNMLARL